MLRRSLYVLPAVFLLSACTTAQQVRWDTYPEQLQQRIDSAAASKNCNALTVLRHAASSSNLRHQQTTGESNGALIAYIEDAQIRAECF